MTWHASATILARRRSSRQGRRGPGRGGLLDLAARWADLHPPESIHSAASFTVPGCEHEEPIAGDGVPGGGGVLRRRARCRARVLDDGGEEADRSRPRAAPPPPAPVGPGPVRAGAGVAGPAGGRGHDPRHPGAHAEAAGWVDAQVAAVAGGRPASWTGWSRRRSSGSSWPSEPSRRPGGRHLRSNPATSPSTHEDVHYAGTLHLEAEIDIADALDLDRALAHGAATQKALGSELSLDARRAEALGDLARTQTALDLAPRRLAGSDETADRLPAAREVVLHAHFDATTAARRSTVFGPTGRLEEGQRLILLEQVKAWCARLPHQGHHQAGHRPQHPALRTGLRDPGPDPEQVILRDRTCVFPWCSRPARAATSTTSSRTTTTPRPRADRSPARRPPTTSPRCAGSTTASRPTPPGATGWSGRACSSGPAPTATGSAATTPAPPRSSHPRRPERR